MLIQVKATGEVRAIPHEEFDPKLHREVVTRDAGQVGLEVLDLEAMHRSAPVITRSYNADDHTVEVTFTTGARVERGGFFSEDYLEELEVSPKAVNLDRIVGAPFLNSHNHYNLSNVLGVVERGWLEETGEREADGKKQKVYEGRAEIRFSDRDDVAPIERDIANGILRQVSVGYSVQHYDRIEPKSERGRELELKLPLYIARDWTPLEISSVPIGADAGATVRSAEKPTRHQCLISVPVQICGAETAAHATTRRGVTMIRIKLRSTGAADEIRAEDFNPKLHELVDDAGREAVRALGIDVPEPTPTATPAADLEAARAEGARMARERDAGIRLACRQAGLDGQVADELVGRESLTLDGARAEILERLAAQSDALPARSAALIPVGGLEADTTRREAMAAALMHRADPGNNPLPEAAREYRGMSLLELSRECLRVRGEPHRGYGKLELVGRAITVGGSDLPNVVLDVANKSLRNGYLGARRSFTTWARRVTLPDFKNVTRVQYGKVPALLKVNESGEFKYATVADSKEAYALVTYGRIISVNRQLLVNDDLDALSRNPALFGRAAGDLESTLVYGILTTNAAMSDGTALFHADHGNLTASGGAPSIAQLTTGKALMRLQTGLEADSIIDVEPRYLIVPAALEVVAQQLVSPLNQAILSPTAPTGINVFSGTIEPVVEPRLDATSAVVWYLAADPNSIDTVEYGYLEGEEGVMTESRIGFEVDGMEIKARLDFGTKAIDWRGLYKNAGA